MINVADLPAVKAQLERDLAAKAEQERALDDVEAVKAEEQPKYVRAPDGLGYTPRRNASQMGRVREDH